jgi:hypothetical protein
VHLVLGGRGEEGNTMRWPPRTNSHLRRPTASGGGGRRFIGDVGLVEWKRCSLQCSASSTGPWGQLLVVEGEADVVRSGLPTTALLLRQMATAKPDDPATGIGGKRVRSVCHLQELLG